MFEWVTSKAWEETLDWLYSQLMGFVSSLFDTMNSMSAEVFDLAWVQAIVHFCTLFGWALFVTGLVVAVFDTAIGAQSGRTDIHGTALNAIKGFFAVCLFTCLLYTSLGYRGGENRHTYPAHTAEKAAGMLEIAASLADFVLVDAGWYLTAPLAEAAVRNAATVFKVCLLYTSAQDPDLWDAVITYEVIKLSYGNSCDTWCCKQVGVTGVEKIIKNAARRLEHVGIENKDFRQLIPLYDRPNALMYLDPPYYKAEDFYLHAGQFNEQSHRDLHDLALHMEGRCLLSYNGCDFIRELYSESKFYKYEFTRDVYKRQVICNRFSKSIEFGTITPPFPRAAPWLC